MISPQLQIFCDAHCVCPNETGVAGVIEVIHYPCPYTYSCPFSAPEGAGRRAPSRSSIKMNYRPPVENVKEQPAIPGPVWD